MAGVKYATLTGFKNTGHCAPNRSPDGYGDKIPTCYEVQLEGETRWRKVFAICWSNACSHYVTASGERLFIRDADVPHDRHKVKTWVREEL